MKKIEKQIKLDFPEAPLIKIFDMSKICVNKVRIFFSINKKKY